MYLAAIPEKQWYRFVIRESFWDHGCYRSRDLVELGPDPAQYIVYPGGRAYYIDPDLRTVSGPGAADPDPDELDDLLWPFVDEDIRHAVGAFRDRQSPPAPNRPFKATASQCIFSINAASTFCASVEWIRDPIGRVPAKIFRPIRNRSRDEIEQYFLQAERILKAHERKAYVYVIFDLQRFFSELCAKAMPEALDPEAVDTYFVQELCRLNADDAFWAGMPHARPPAALISLTT